MARVQKDSLNAIRDFKDTAGIDIQLPDGIDFRDLGIDSPNMTAIYGKLPDMEMAVVAGKGNITQDQIVEFIRSQDTGIPNLDRAYVEIPKTPKVTPTPPESGLSSGNLWTGTLANGDIVHVAVLPRKDGAGSYMVIVSGKEATVEGFDDEFENVFKSVRTRPVSP